jgi:outer membrane protein TolC
MTTQLKFILLICLFGLATLVLPARIQARELSLSMAVDRALSDNPGLVASNFGILAAQEKVAQARSGIVPQVSLIGQSSHTTNPMWAFGTRLNQEAITAQDFDPGRLNNPDGITNFGSGVNMTWPVYDSGQTYYGIQQASLGHEAARLFSDRTRHQVIAETIMAYIGVLFAREYQQVVRQTLETAQAHLKLVQSRFEGGFVAKSDLLRAQVHIADLEQQFSEAKSRTDIAGCRLNVAMGVRDLQEFTLSTPLKAEAQVKDDIETWTAKALERRPDLKLLTAQKEIAKKEIEKSKAARYPSLNLSGNYEINSEDFSGTATNYTVGALVSIPLFTGGRISARINEARISLRQINARCHSLEQQICGEVRQAFFKAQSAWERIRVTAAAVGQSKESLRIVKNRYNSGLFTITDLLDAQVLVQQSLTHQIKAIHDYKAAATGLALAAGTIEEQ